MMSFPETVLATQALLAMLGARVTHDPFRIRTTITVGRIAATNQGGTYPDCLPGLIPLLHHKLAYCAP